MAEDLAGTSTTVAPAAPEAPAAPAAPAPSSPASTAPAAPSEGTQPEKTPEHYASKDDFERALQKRLGKESRRLERVARAEAEARFWKEQAESRGREPPAQPKGKPQAKDFSDVDSYMDALTDWKLEQREAKQAKEWQERQPQEQAQEREREFAQSIASKLSAGPEKHDDFEDVVYADGMEWTPAMIGYIHDAADPVELAYQLGLRRDELRRISRLPPAMQPVEVFKFEQKLREPPKPTAAPAPIVPGTVANSGARKDWSDMNTEEHVKAWLKRPRK